MGKILHIEERYLNAGHTKVEIYELKIFIIQKKPVSTLGYFYQQVSRYLLIQQMI